MMNLITDIESQYFFITYCIRNFKLIPRYMFYLILFFVTEMIKILKSLKPILLINKKPHECGASHRECGLPINNEVGT